MFKNCLLSMFDANYYRSLNKSFTRIQEYLYSSLLHQLSKFFLEWEY